MQCLSCDVENAEGTKFCIECGVPLQARCPRCGSAHLPRARFCGECGTPLPSSSLAAPPAALVPRSQPPLSYTPRHLAEKILTSRSALEGERKPVTVLFCDLANSTPLAERLGPEAMHTLLNQFFALALDEVHRYEGTINQFLGDGFMALFGAPLAVEDHARRALLAALGIHQGIRELRADLVPPAGVELAVRLGLNTGLVVVGRIGDNLRMDYTAVGDTTNLAARMQQMAPAGAILALEATYRAAREAFEWRGVGPTAVKGKAEPVSVYELLGQRAVTSRFEVLAQRGLTQFVGRYPELQQLLAAWEQVEQGEGRVVSVVGEAGIGKSRLVYELKQWLTQEDAPYVEGSCFAYGDSISYLPFLAIVKDVCGVEGTASEAEAKRRIAHALTTLSLDPAAVAPYLHNLLAFAVEDARFARLTPELIRQRTVEALKTLLLAAATRHPMVLILEDVHWIDKASEEVLTSVVEAMGGVPLLLALVYRPEYLHAWAHKAYHAQIALTRLPGASSAAMVRAILTKPYATRVPLERLSPEQSQAMVQDLLGTATLPPELEQLIATRTDGNPLFVEELTRSLLESGDLVRTGEGYVFQKPLAALDLPTTLQGVLLTRIDRLHEDLKAVLQMASVIGRVFSHPLLAHVLPHDLELDTVLLQLADLEFVYVTSLAPQREYSFKHVLTQAAVYQTLLRPKREEYHERIGKAIEALYAERLEEYYEVLAYHYVRSGNKDKAVEYLDLANQKAAKANAMEEAKRSFDEAMALLNTLPETERNQHRRIVLLVNQGTVMLLLFKYPEYYDLLTRYEAMAIRVGDQGLLGAFYARLGWGEYGFGYFNQAIQTLAKAAEFCEAAGNAEDAGLAYVLLEWSHMWKGDYDQVLTLKEDVLRMMVQRFNLRWYLFALTAASLAYAALGHWDHAVEDGHKALHAGEEFSDPSVISFAAWIISWAYTARGDLVRALEYAKLGVQNALTTADKSWAQSLLGWAWCRAGEPRKGVELLAEALAINRSGHPADKVSAQSAHVPSELFQMLYLGEGYWLAGEFDHARQTLAELLALAERCGTKFYLGSAHRLLGEVALTINPTQAEAPLAAPHFEQSIAILQQINAENELALAYAGYGRLHRQQGHIAPARDYLTRALEIFARLGTLLEPDKVRQALAELSAR